MCNTAAHKNHRCMIVDYSQHAAITKVQSEEAISL